MSVIIHISETTAVIGIDLQLQSKLHAIKWMAFHYCCYSYTKIFCNVPINAILKGYSEQEIGL